MSEAFINRFEMADIPPMTQPEMVTILMEKFDLEAAGITKKEVGKLVDLQIELETMSQGRTFDGFNLDNTYRFSLRNLERTMSDFKRRIESERKRPPGEILREEAYLEYAGLLSQTTSEEDPRKNNLGILGGLFKKHLDWAADQEIVDEDPETKRKLFKVETVTEGGEEWLALNGGGVRKLSAIEMLGRPQMELCQK